MKEAWKPVACILPEVGFPLSLQDANLGPAEMWTYDLPREDLSPIMRLAHSCDLRKCSLAFRFVRSIHKSREMSVLLADSDEQSAHISKCS